MFFWSVFNNLLDNSVHLKAHVCFYLFKKIISCQNDNLKHPESTQECSNYIPNRTLVSINLFIY